MDLSINKEVLKIELQNAIKHDEFLLYYQPQFNLTTGMFDGVEALLRWQHPTRGLLLPAEFISLMEETGLIVRMGEWVLRTACAQISLWQHQGYAPLRIAVNISGRQFHQKNFVEMVMKALTDTDLKPKYLELELSENIILQDAEAVVRQIHRLKNLGISIALDDFGMGYSSISHLKHIEVDRIKIDKSFIQNAPQDKQDATIVRAIITLAKGLDVEVIAEGVETVEQLQPLIDHHCHGIQGFYFSKPLPAHEVEKFLWHNKLHLLGYASGIAGVDPKSSKGPLVLQRSVLMSRLIHEGIGYKWDAIIHPSKDELRTDEVVAQACTELADKISTLVKERTFFNVIGGDHTSAIGVWSGAYDALHTQGSIGLIWIDAHMDSHTPETTESGRLHGMPLACLLGFGYPTLTSILLHAPKFKPENVCLIGVRSFESGEAALLKRLNVRVYFMDEVKQRGFDVVLREATALVSMHTIAYGVSLDLDGLDPEDAPGVGVREPDGIRAPEITEGIKSIAADKKFIGIEIVEFDPHRDEDHKTEKLIVNLLEILARAKCHD